MKVTFCAYDFIKKAGGPNAWLLRVLPALQAMGVDIQVLFFSENPNRSTTASALAEKGVKCVISKHLSSTEKKIKWIIQELKKDRPDVFVPNLVVPAYYASGWVRKAGIPTVGILHSDDEFHRGLQDVFVFGEDFFKLSAIVCVSRYLEDEVIGKRASGICVKRIPYGAPVPAEVCTFPDETLRLAYVGRLVEKQKRISDVTSALCQVARQIPGVEASIFGVGPDLAKVEKILTDKGKNLPVKLIGLVPSDEIQKQLLEHHVLVLLSDYEGLPIALMEAMACGLVPVCSNIRSGLPELVQHEINGLIVKDRGEGFVAAIERLKNDRLLWKTLSKNARNKIEEGYSSEVGAQGWYRLLEKLKGFTLSENYLEVPVTLTLPPVHPDLAREDFRQTAWPLHLARRAKDGFKKVLGV